MSKKIMIVDDEQDIIDVTRTVLEIGGYNVVSAKTGRDCLSKLERENVDLIILDIMMPEMSGWDLAAKIKDNPNWSNIPLAFLTIKGDAVSIGMGKMAAVEYIVKPFDKETLLKRVNEILEKND